MFCIVKGMILTFHHSFKSPMDVLVGSVLIYYSYDVVVVDVFSYEILKGMRRSATVNNEHQTSQSGVSLELLSRFLSMPLSTL